MNTDYFLQRVKCVAEAAGLCHCTACGGRLMAEQGSFTSPRYPDAYSRAVECVWEIEVSAGNKLMIEFR